MRQEALRHATGLRLVTYIAARGNHVLTALYALALHQPAPRPVRDVNTATLP
jgi:hypothetical protein